MEVAIKRKRGRPRKNEMSCTTNAGCSPGPAISAATSVSTGDEEELYKKKITRNGGDEMVGRVISGLVEASFEAGYLVNVQLTTCGAADDDNSTCCYLRGVVFRPDKVSPITITNDVAPHANMYLRMHSSSSDQLLPFMQPPPPHVTSATTTIKHHVAAESCHEETDINKSCSANGGEYLNNHQLGSNLQQAPARAPPASICSNVPSSSSCSSTPCLVPAILFSNNNKYTTTEKANPEDKQVDDDNDQVPLQSTNSSGDFMKPPNEHPSPPPPPPQSCSFEQQQDQLLSLFNSTTPNNLNLELNQPPTTTFMETTASSSQTKRKLIDIFPTTNFSNEAAATTTTSHQRQNIIDESISVKENAQLHDQRPKLWDHIPMALGQPFTTTQGSRILVDQDQTIHSAGPARLTLSIDQHSTFISEFQK